MLKVMKLTTVGFLAATMTVFSAFAGQFDGLNAPSEWEAVSPYYYWLGHTDRPREKVYINKKSLQKAEDGVSNVSVLMFRETPERRGEDNKLRDATYIKASIDCFKQRYGYEVLSERLRQSGDETWYKWDNGHTASVLGLDWTVLNPQKMASWDDYVIYHLCGPTDLK